MASEQTTIDLIILDVAEIERNPLPGQPDDEMRVTAEELRVILEEHLAKRVREAIEDHGR